MRTIVEILRSLIGLFLDDEFLAIAIIGVVLMTALLVLVLGVQSAAAGCFLLGGNLAVLTASVLRAAGRRNR